MNLDNLKPAWQQFRLLNAMESIDKNEILFVIDRNQDIGISKTHPILISFIMFAVLIICCQGG